MNNPFELVTASKLTAKEAVDLWCDDSRLDRVRGGESCFINGNRGTGKSMLFRVLQRDCQELMPATATPDFLAVYFSVRDSDLMAEEFGMIEGHRQRLALCESHFVILIVRQLLVEIRKTDSAVPVTDRESVQQLLVRQMGTAYQFSDVESPSLRTDDWLATLQSAIDALELEAARLKTYVLTQLYADETGYRGPLFFFDALLGPICDFLLERTRCRIFVLVDDGDDLPKDHKVVLNTWIARRRRSVVFKVSTMYTYDTYDTRSGSKIQAPHDFVEYDIASRFLDYNSEDYVDLVRRICARRLEQAEIRNPRGELITDPRLFFPKDHEQESRMNDLRARLMQEYSSRYDERAVGDNVYRHLTSEYMKLLRRGRSTSTFRYAGFKTLAILSSGVVRNFIVCAQKMYDDASRDTSHLVTEISPGIQNVVVRNYADEVLDEIYSSRRKRIGSDGDWEMIGNLVNGLGNIFRQKMFSDDSERRVFSFAFQKKPGDGLQALLDMAVGEGYFARGFISKKEGTGRRHLYVLTRAVAPAFGLDVSSYSGYLSLEPAVLEDIAGDGGDVRVRGGGAGQLELPFTAMERDGEWSFSEREGRDDW